MTGLFLPYQRAVSRLGVRERLQGTLTSGTGLLGPTPCRTHSCPHCSQRRWWEGPSWFWTQRQSRATRCRSSTLRSKGPCYSPSFLSVSMVKGFVLGSVHCQTDGMTALAGFLTAWHRGQQGVRISTRQECSHRLPKGCFPGKLLLNDILLGRQSRMGARL